MACLLLAAGPGLPCPAQGPAPAAQPQAFAPDPVPALGAAIRRLIETPRFKAATWGIKVVSLDSGRTLFEHNAGKYFIPASNTKLFTAAMALQELGPELRIRTSLYGSARPGADGVLAGDLILYGRGDPTLMRPWSSGPFQPDPLESLAIQLRARGVRTIQGDLVGDDSFFAEPPYGPGWEWEDLRFSYGAEATALAMHHNSVDLWVYPAPAAGQPCFLFAQPGQDLIPLRNATTTGAAGTEPQIRAERLPGEQSIRVAGTLPLGADPVRLAVAVHDSALWSAGLLRRALVRHDIELLGQVRSVHFQDRDSPLDPTRLVELGHLDSPPMREILRDLLKTSNNLYAQLILLQAGARRSGRTGTVHQGLLAMAAWMARAGLRPEDTVLEEGSGLSRRNLIKPEGIVQLLVSLDRQPEGAAFRDLLPVAGVDGTLRHRMEGGPAQGNLRAKTGTLRNTRALSGYVTSAGGERLAFALMLNNDHEEPRRTGGSGEPKAETVLDAIAELLARFPSSAQE
ncbi:MAG: D-alanyl-D-alanine carboxypeptidase/D-alanyl-D-alanine-endopeptidase [Holophaga sp.]|nr:D-alanyl-D-alanine carboxypeptidase/D-alanyl-D-alanine-endopeptidase [Holophaga sp.]